MTTLLIHRYTCEDCGGTAHADRGIECWKCGSEMDIAEWKVDKIEVEHND